MPKSESAELNSHRSDARLEKEKSLRCESHDSSPKVMDVDGQSSDHPNPSQTSVDKLQTDNTCVQVLNSPCLDGSHKNQNATAETFPDLANKAVTSGSTVSETRGSSLPNFSIIEGEICLHDLSIGELQESFRATFGRQTSIKDKLWLIRRIAMALINSCEVPTTRFTIKEGKIVNREVNHACMMNIPETELSPSYQVASLSHGAQRDPSISISNQVEEHKVVPEKTPTKPLLAYDRKGDCLKSSSRKRARKPSRRYEDELSDFDESPENHFSKRIRKPTRRYSELSDLETKDGSSVNCVGKRVRKPNKRYIEELSDVETMECTGRSTSSLNIYGIGQPSPESRISSISDFDSWSPDFVTTQHTFGGPNLKIPHAPRFRRRRPRKNFVALTNFIKMENERSDPETSNHLELDLDQRMLDSAANKYDNSCDTSSTFKVCPKRKHHRVWSLSEVLKLVDGVARYGAGKWSEIRQDSFASSSYRTSVDLKDKWRNLLRASYTQSSIHKSANSGSSTSMPIPRSILSRVRELADIQSQSGIEFRPSRYAINGVRSADDSSGFL